MKYIVAVIVFAVMSIIGFCLMGIDKRRAINNKWRISESTLLSVALLGGGIGAIVGMFTFRHKTKHKRFLIGLPLLTMLSIIVVVVILIFV